MKAQCITDIAVKVPVLEAFAMSTCTAISQGNKWLLIAYASFRHDPLPTSSLLFWLLRVCLAIPSCGFFEVAI